MPRKFCLAILILFGLAGCSLYAESRVRSALVDAGLSPPMAQCMAKRMVDRLSTDQLLSLKRLGELREDKSGTLSSRQFLNRYRGAVDPEVYAVLAKAGISCAISI
jgi:hypothetical protein